jgi:hypothetical protein
LASASEALIPLPVVAVAVVRIELDPPQLERDVCNILLLLVLLVMVAPIVDPPLLLFRSESPINIVVVAKPPPPNDSTTTLNSWMSTVVTPCALDESLSWSCQTRSRGMALALIGKE